MNSLRSHNVFLSNEKENKINSEILIPNLFSTNKDYFTTKTHFADQKDTELTPNQISQINNNNLFQIKAIEKPIQTNFDKNNDSKQNISESNTIFDEEKEISKIKKNFAKLDINSEPFMPMVALKTNNDDENGLFIIPKLDFLSLSDDKSIKDLSEGKTVSNNKGTSFSLQDNISMNDNDNLYQYFKVNKNQKWFDPILKSTLNFIPEKKELYKTELCKSFGETGICRYGNKCHYAHGICDLRPRKRVENFKTQMCTDPARYGSHHCLYGKRCNYAHPGEAIRRACITSYYDNEYFEALKNDYKDINHPFGLYI